MRTRGICMGMRMQYLSVAKKAHSRPGRHEDGHCLGCIYSEVTRIAAILATAAHVTYIYTHKSTTSRHASACAYGHGPGGVVPPAAGST